MKNLMKYVTLGLLPVFLVLLSLSPSNATIHKRPLTLKTYADQRYYEWTGTIAMASPDTMLFLADTATANMYNLDPSGFLMTNKSASAGFNPWTVYPKVGFPEKVCVRIARAPDADGTVHSVLLQWASTKTGTVVNDVSPTTMTSTAAGSTIYNAGSILEPAKFFRIFGAISSATDVDTISRVTAFACDD